MIRVWLIESRHSGITNPETLLLDETARPTVALREYLTERLIEHRVSLEVIRDMASVLGWTAVERRLRPSTIQLERGDFGEMLACEVLENFQLVTIPVRKVRYQIHADQSLVGADVVALELDGGDIASLHFGEAKLRTTADTAAGRDAHAQLQTWLEDDFAEILMFIGTRLSESDRGLYDAFIRYLSQQDRFHDRYHILLIWEAAQWTDSVVTGIPAPPDQLDPLRVRVTRISDLAQLVDDTYNDVRDHINDGA